MTPIKAILIKPLDGQPSGTEREFSKTDFDRLKARGAVRALPHDKFKAAPVPLNKMAPLADNKTAPIQTGDIGRAAKPKA